MTRIGVYLLAMLALLLSSCSQNSDDSDGAQFDRSLLDPQFSEDGVTWDSLSVIQSGSDGINVIAELNRRDANGQLITSLSGLYLVTKLGGQWGVIGRSVLAR